MPRPRRRADLLELLAAVHAAAFFAAAAWAFGGNADWVQGPLTAFGAIGIFVTLAVVLTHDPLAQAGRRRLLRLWPLALYNLIVLFSCRHPGLRQLHLDGETFLVPQTIPAWLPSAALPGEVLRPLGLFDVSYLACFNLYLVVRHRRVLRGLLLFVFANALALSIFGTLQKLTHATGIYFGRIKSPQLDFFASFVYHNHWGAFMILMSAVGVGLTWHYGRLRTGRDFFHSFAFALLIALLPLAVTVPLSGSRSSTILLVALLGGSFAQWTVRLLRRSKERQETAALPLIGAIAAILLAAGGLWLIDRDIIVARVAKTQEQLADFRAEQGVNQRLLLYRDTWRMAADRPWFGWGTGSYPHVFLFYNTQEPDRRDHLPKFYHDAHNDWLQSLAEHGFVGTLLLGLAGLVPLAGLRRGRILAGSIPRYLFCGCGLLLLYAWVEFPFGNVAVVLSWWLCFFCALTYARLSADDGAAPA